MFWIFVVSFQLGFEHRDAVKTDFNSADNVDELDDVRKTKESDFTFAEMECFAINEYLPCLIQDFHLEPCFQQSIYQGLFDTHQSVFGRKLVESVSYHKILFYSVDVSLQCLDDTGRLVELVSEALFQFIVFLFQTSVLPHYAIERDEEDDVCNEEADDDEN